MGRGIKFLLFALVSAAMLASTKPAHADIDACINRCELAGGALDLCIEVCEERYDEEE